MKQYVCRSGRSDGSGRGRGSRKLGLGKCLADRYACCSHRCMLLLLSGDSCSDVSHTFSGALAGARTVLQCQVQVRVLCGALRNLIR